MSGVPGEGAGGRCTQNECSWYGWKCGKDSYSRQEGRDGRREGQRQLCCVQDEAGEQLDRRVCISGIITRMKHPLVREDSRSPRVTKYRHMKEEAISPGARCMKSPISDTCTLCCTTRSNPLAPQCGLQVISDAVGFKHAYLDGRLLGLRRMDAQRAQDAARQAARMQPGMLEIIMGGGGGDPQPDPAFGRTTPGGTAIPATAGTAPSLPIPGRQQQQKGGAAGGAAAPAAAGRTSPMLQLLQAGRVVATLLNDAAGVPNAAGGARSLPGTFRRPPLLPLSAKLTGTSLAGSDSGTDGQPQHLWQALSEKRRGPIDPLVTLARNTAPAGFLPWSLARPKYDSPPQLCPLGQLAPDNGTHPRVLTFRWVGA